MAANKRLKELVKRLGLYSIGRKLYRQFSKDVQQQKHNDRQLYSQFFKAGDLVFDIGANVGQTSEIFRELGAHVVALEPNPNCCRVLEADFGSSPEFRLVSKAVGAEVGQAELTFASTDAVGSLKADWHGLRHASGQLQHALVEVTTLDQLISEFGTPRFCKIDVEGFELEVLQGLKSKIPCISFEFFAEDLDQVRLCIETLARLGPIECNLCEMDGASLTNDIWLNEGEFLAYLQTPECPAMGDIFVRFKKSDHSKA